MPTTNELPTMVLLFVLFLHNLLQSQSPGQSNQLAKLSASVNVLAGTGELKSIVKGLFSMGREGWRQNHRNGQHSGLVTAMCHDRPEEVRERSSF